jgi:hypothetical protein
MTEGAKRASPVEMILGGFSLACWLAAIAFLIVENLASSTAALRPLAPWAQPVVAFALPLAVGSQAALALQRPARSPPWRWFQAAMLAVSAGALLLAVWRFAL